MNAKVAAFLSKHNFVNHVDVKMTAEGLLSDMRAGLKGEKADEDMKQGKVTFLAGGTGKPFYTTDTAATLRAIELNCEAILMGKNGVSGVFSSDPTKDSSAKFFKEITFQQMIDLNLQIMDLSAIQLIKDKDIEIRVFSMSNAENFVKVVSGDDIGTVCKKGE